MNEKAMYSLIAMALFAILVGGGYFWGKSAAKAEYTAEVVKVQEKAKQREDELQQAAIDIASAMYATIGDKVQHLDETNDLIDQLRRESEINEQNHRKAEATDCRCWPKPVVPAVYRVYNKTADYPNLPNNPDRLVADPEKDGLEAIRYAVSEYNTCGEQLNYCRSIVELAECIQ